VVLDKSFINLAWLKPSATSAKIAWANKPQVTITEKMRAT
jgi:hypothetical protein